MIRRGDAFFGNLFVRDLNQLSSILNALKKLETQRSGQDLVRSLSTTVRSKKEESGKRYGFSRITIGFFIVVFFAFLAFALQMGFKRFMKAEEGTVVAGFDATTDPAPASTLPSASLEGKDRHRPTEAPEELKNTQTFSTTREKSDTKMPTARYDAAIPGTASVERRFQEKEKEREPEGEIVVRPPSAQNTAVSPDKQSAIKPVEDSGLKLMAIAWSAVPAQRIAVINGRIVREGESLEGVFVSRINENDVILQKNDELVKLVFKVR
jgi:hypothetical protein